MNFNAERKNRVMRARDKERTIPRNRHVRNALFEQTNSNEISTPVYIQLQLHLGNYLWYFSTFLVKFSDSRRNHVPRTMQRTHLNSEHQMKCGEMVKCSWKKRFLKYN